MALRCARAYTREYMCLDERISTHLPFRDSYLRESGTQSRNPGASKPKRWAGTRVTCLAFTPRQISRTRHTIVEIRCDRLVLAVAGQRGDRADGGHGDDPQSDHRHHHHI